MKRRKNNVISLEKHKKKWKWNLGLLIFSIILIYLCVLLITSALQVKTNVYEVRRGSIIQDTTYTGFVIRDESVINVSDKGYIEYYYPELSRIGIGHNIYTLSDNEIKDREINTEIELTNIQINEINAKIQAFNNTFIEENFDTAYRLKTDVEAILNSKDNAERIRSVNELSIEGADQAFESGMSGVILYEVDGYESLLMEDIKEEYFQKQEYSETLLSSGSLVNVGDPAYKIISDERWCIYINVDDSEINFLKDLNSLNVRILKDDIIVPATFELVQINGANYGELTFNEGMVRYATERYLDVELIIENQVGYKIPLTSVTSSSYYKIPHDFVIEGGFILLKDKYDSVTRKEINSFNYDIVRKEENKVIEAYYYVSTDQLNLSDVIVQENTNNTYIVSETEVLNFVYNVNRGYARPRYVKILNQSDEYYIVDEQTGYSVFNYDYIALYANEVTEGEFVY